FTGAAVAVVAERVVRQFLARQTGQEGLTSFDRRRGRERRGQRRRCRQVGGDRGCVGVGGAAARGGELASRGGRGRCGCALGERGWVGGRAGWRAGAAPLTVGAGSAAPA